MDVELGTDRDPVAGLQKYLAGYVDRTSGAHGRRGLEHGQLASLVTADALGWLALAYTVVIGGIAGFGLWFRLIARCSMSRVAPFGLLLPLFALISSVMFLGDRMTAKLMFGGLLAIAGVAVTQIRPRIRPA